MDQWCLDPSRPDELVQAMGLSGISKSTVSKLCKDIDERVGEFLNRPLTGEWPYLWLDATYLKVRQGGRIVPVAAIIAVAANTEGRREIIGLGIGPSRGRDILDRVPSIPARSRPWGASDWSSATRIQASKPPSPGSSKQPGNAVASTGCATPWPMSRVVSILSSPLPSGRPFDQPDRTHAGETWRKVAEQLRPRWPKLADLMDASEHDVLAYMSFPRQHRHQTAQHEPD